MNPALPNKIRKGWVNPAFPKNIMRDGIKKSAIISNGGRAG
jgi:hypothetical protein